MEEAVKHYAHICMEERRQIYSPAKHVRGHLRLCELVHTLRCNSHTYVAPRTSSPIVA
jgi:hypothetical protein